MYLKTISKYCYTEKAIHTYYRLCESYRDEFGKTRQRMVLGMGRLLELADFEERLVFLERLNELIKGAPTVFSANIDPKIEALAQQYFAQLNSKKRIPKSANPTQEYENIDLKSLKNKDVKEIGAESLCYQAFKQLKIDSFLESRGWSKEQINLASTHIISRAVYPASELKTVSWIKENSAICELTDYDATKITKDKLYSIAHKLYEQKSGLETFLSRCTNDLFNLEDKIILYDLTNTYFEGRMTNSKKAKFGRSKEKRSDAKIIVLALVINLEGFPKYYDIFEGNTTDSETLQTIIEKLNSKFVYTDKRPIIVMDAGIATEKNIVFLKQEKYDYVCVSRSNIKQYQAIMGNEAVRIFDKKNQPIELLNVRVENDTDNYLWVNSHAKAQKENGMFDQFSARFEEGLRGIANSISKKNGTKKIDKVHERIGRLKEKYSSIHQCYEITVTPDRKGNASSLSFEKNEDHPKIASAGIYFLRTSLNGLDEKTLWTIYNAIREIEYTFRVLKTDLDLRPIYHKTDDASMAHLHLGILAYWLVSTIRYQLKIKGCNHSWSEIVRIMNTQKIVTTTMKNDKHEAIEIKQCSEPNEKVLDIYRKLNYKSVPLKRRKSVWHTGAVFENMTIEYQIDDSG
jgi:arsenate reductase-like glutaredoxin family protein